MLRHSSEALPPHHFETNRVKFLSLFSSCKRVFEQRQVTLQYLMARIFDGTLEDFIVNGHKLVAIETRDNGRTFMQMYGFPILVYTIWYYNIFPRVSLHIRVCFDISILGRKYKLVLQHETLTEYLPKPLKIYVVAAEDRMVFKFKMAA